VATTSARSLDIESILTHTYRLVDLYHKMHWWSRVKSSLFWDKIQLRKTRGYPTVHGTSKLYNSVCLGINSVPGGYISILGLIIQVSKLVHFTWYNTFSNIPPSTSMRFGARVRTWRVTCLYSVLYSEIALSQKPFGIGHMCLYIFFLRMTDTTSMTSQNIDFPPVTSCICVYTHICIHIHDWTLYNTWRYDIIYTKLN
jgi:hypothetical protein